MCNKLSGFLEMIQGTSVFNIQQEFEIRKPILKGWDKQHKITQRILLTSRSRIVRRDALKQN